MTHFTYKIDLTGLDVLKNEEQQFNSFFYSGHPGFLIPNFSQEVEDIWLGFLDYLESVKQKPLYDQDGGEIVERKIIDTESGLTSCKYIAYDIQFDEKDSPQDYEVNIIGYVVTIDSKIEETYFLATSVEIKEL